MSFYTHTDKQSGDGLAITNWNDLSSAVAGNSGLTLALNPADKIGIGVATPAEKLEVAGNLKVKGQYVVQDTQNGGPGRGIYMWAANNSSWGIYMGQPGENRALDGGSAPFGFGFSSHAMRFRSNSNSSNGFIFENNQNQNLFSVRGSDGYSEFKGDVKAAKFIGDGSGLTNLPVSSTWNQNGSAISYAAGNVGIGTAAPAVKLQVGNTILHRNNYNYANTSAIIHAQNHNGGNTPGAMQSVLSLIREGVSAQAFGNMADFRLGRYENSGTSSRTQLDIYLTEDSFAPVSVMSMRSNGNVGIGTASPKQRLHVNGDYYGKGHVFLHAHEGDGSSGTAYLQARDTSNSSSIGLQLRTQQDGIVKDVMKLNPDGNVGIGTAPSTNPYEKLSVKGALRINDPITDSGNFAQLVVTDTLVGFYLDKGYGGHNGRSVTFDGDSNWDFHSDKRLKTNITNEKDILKRLIKLDVKSYKWKDNPDAKFKSIGMIAQDVKPLFPTLVGELEDPKTKKSTMTLKYGSFGVLAVGAIKELKEEHDKKIKALEKKVAALEKKLKAA